MSLDAPTTASINANIIAQLEASLNQTIPLLPKSFLRVLAKVLAGVWMLLYKYCGFIFLQLFVQTASSKETIINGVSISPLQFWGRLIGVGDPASATNAELNIEITVVNQTGTLDSHTQLFSSKNGVTYLTKNAITLDASTKEVAVIAASDQSGGGGAGEIGNLDVGDILTFANPVSNIGRNAEVTEELVTGADGEDIEVYRQRIFDKFQKRPQGGAYADYQIWGEEPAGILNVYPYTSSCPGQVDLYVEAVPTESNPWGIPTNAQLQEVLDSVYYNQNGLASRRPAGALPLAYVINRLEFDVVVESLSVENPDQVIADIESAVEAYFLNREPYIVGLSVLPRFDRITRSGVSGAVEDVVSAYGGTFINLTITLNNANVEIYDLGFGEKARARSVTVNQIPD